MNKKECERIGYLFSNFVAGEIDSDDLLIEIGNLDKRIREEFEFWGDCRERDQAIEDRFCELMTRELGRGWSLKKKANDIKTQMWKQAEKDVGENL